MINDYLSSEKACARPGITWRTPNNRSKRSEEFPQPIKIGPALPWPANHLDAWPGNHPAGQKKRVRTDER